MTAKPEASLSSLDIPGHFASLPDPRHPAFRDFHLFGDLMAIALCAVLSGATSWETIVAFGVRKKQWLLSLGLSLPHGIPSHDTFNRVFAALDPRAFQDCFNGWLCSVCEASVSSTSRSMVRRCAAAVGRDGGARAPVHERGPARP